MPSPEGEKRRPRGRIPPEQPPKPEEETSLWYRAAQYSGEQQAGTTYTQAQDTIFHNECDLSAYRMLLDQIWHVAVLGGVPAEVSFQQELERILYTEGTPTTLPDDVLTMLHERREQARQLGPWVEGHHRPGIVFERKKRNR
jgi:hypothetical protein